MANLTNVTVNFEVLHTSLLKTDLHNTIVFFLL